MAAEIAVELFFDLLQQSGLAPDAQIAALKAEFCEGENPPENSRLLAEELIRRGLLTEWQADMLLQGKHRGFRLGPHRILRPLGQGGMSKVFLAEHEMMHRRCAIKVLPSKYQEDPDLLKRFQHEACAIAALDHPHIVRAYDFNKDVRYGKEIHYLVMEYVEGQDLRRMVESQGPLDYRKAADFIAQAAEGLAHAHEAGFVHRDVKPANLLVDPNGVLKILDLGLARSTFEGERAWQSPEEGQSAVGTADYVAPEQVMDSRSVDGRADIYSLGHTFYYLLTGRRPFPKSTLVELLMAHRVEKPEPISASRPDVPLELVEVVERMTAKSPTMRFQTAKEVADSLRTWLRDSASGQYSRISALMAAAMRAKQAPGGKSEEETKAEAELLLVDEALGGLKIGDTAEENGAAAVVQEKSDSGIRRGAAAKAKTPEVRKETAKAASDSGTLRKPSESGKMASLPRAKTDLLLELLPGQAEALPTVPLQTMPLSRRREEDIPIWRSPWLWIALAAVVGVGGLLFAILAPSTPEKPSVPAAQKPPETPVPPVVPVAPKKPPKKPPEVPVTPKEQPKPPEVPVTPKEQPKPPEVPVTPKEQPKPPEVPVTPKEQPKPPEVPVTPKEQPKPPVAKSDPVKLLAELKTFSFDFQSMDRNLNSPLNKTIARQALEAVTEAGLTPAEKNPNIMHIQVKFVDERNTRSVVLEAWMDCRAPEGVVTVWKQSKPIATFDPRRTKAEVALKQIRSGSGKFFDAFRNAVHQAKTKSKVE